MSRDLGDKVKKIKVWVKRDVLSWENESKRVDEYEYENCYIKLQADTMLVTIRHRIEDGLEEGWEYNTTVFPLNKISIYKIFT